MSVSKELKKGALVNFFGLVGKMAAPVFLIVVNRLFGPDVFGIYITANIAIEIIIAFLTSGFKNGTLVFVSRFADKKEEEKDLYVALANAFLWSVGLSTLVLVGFLLFGQDLLEIIYENEFSSSMGIIFQIMILSIPLMAFERIVLSATQGLKIMKYDALSNGWLSPLSLLLFSVLFWFIYPGIKGVAFAYLCTKLILFIISVIIFTKEFNWKNLFKSFHTFKINGELIKFSLTLNINATLNRFVTGIDVLMLPTFGFSPTMVGFYGAGSMLIREIREVKTIFSSAFNPLIVRLHKEKKFSELSHHLSKTISWVTTIAFPIILLMAVLKDYLLVLIHPEYSGDSSFMYYLLPIPYLYCSFGLAGNVVAMAGYSKLNLMNSVIVATTNIILNLYLIPKFGLIGAAFASAVSMFVLVSFEVIEARIVANTKIYISEVFTSHFAGFMALLFFYLTFLITDEKFSFLQNPIAQIIGIILIMSGVLGFSKFKNLKAI